MSGEDPYRELAQWLQEVARRRHVEPVSRAPRDAVPVSPPAALARRAHWRHVRQILSLAALTAAYLQYHLLDVMLQIATMHPVVTFV